MSTPRKTFNDLILNLSTKVSRANVITNAITAIDMNANTTTACIDSKFNEELSLLAENIL